ncbi:unnamed protein product [Dovyalis caffra]|uniref:Uncharacterized protein n=1 Tax=Dovyalis caffra TaxID=77055 RepID=A0AAV1SSZ5_9ROSI|nr:unnamed protein product [Dovyalis caffra]
MRRPPSPPNIPAKPADERANSALSFSPLTLSTQVSDSRPFTYLALSKPHSSSPRSSLSTPGDEQVLQASGSRLQSSSNLPSSSFVSFKSGYQAVFWFQLGFISSLNSKSMFEACDGYLTIELPSFKAKPKLCRFGEDLIEFYPILLLSKCLPSSLFDMDELDTPFVKARR